MNGTPRLRSAFPSTPQSGQKTYGKNEQDIPSSPLPKRPAPESRTKAPAIPFNILDAPSQRFYVSLVYIGLTVWRLYDFSTLLLHDTDGFWLFTKWVGIDTVFLYALSGLQIPWLQWSSSTFSVLFIVHGILNWMLMFRIPVPLFAWLGALSKVLYDRELTVSEKSVKPASVLHNSSLILGKQIIHILPEGSAVLNPDEIPFCIGASEMSVNLPIRINQTTPIQIDLLRVDLDTNVNETITLSAKEIKKLKKQADKDYGKNDHTSPRTLQYQVKETGLYRLERVVDESKLEVQRRSSDALVVQCPSAMMVSATLDRCKGDLSDFHLQVNAIPPLKVKYSKKVNWVDQGHVVLTIHPENLVSPLAHQRISGAVIPHDLPLDVSWAKTQSIRIPLNESLGTRGMWQYMVDEVRDACGNVANYTHLRLPDNRDVERYNPYLEPQDFLVHERPKIALHGCDTQNPLKVEKGKSTTLPIHVNSTGIGWPSDSPYELLYVFTPQDELLPDQHHTSDTPLQGVRLASESSSFEVREPGLYTLVAIGSPYCEGEILEPSSCLLSNPPEPDLSIASEPITDKCAGNSIGLLVDLDLLGTPPFRVYYTVKLRGDSTTPKVLDVHRFHTQLELRPPHAGHYTYDFGRISDGVYSEPRSLSHKNLVLEQDVKPPAAARILDGDSPRKACIGEPANFIIQMLGEPPFKIEYEIVHNARRTRYVLNEEKERRAPLKTGSLDEGGEYVLALTSITDKSGCKTPLEREVTIDVGLQRPRASFGGLIDGRRSISALEAMKVSLPIRLQGEAPWTLEYRNRDDPKGTIIKQILWNSNDQIDISAQGTYELLALRDASCPGSIDMSANQFTVDWIPRPAIEVVENALIEKIGLNYVKNEVCQGDEDAIDVSFIGTAPFKVEYEQRHKPQRGSQSMSLKKLDAGSTSLSIRMETSEPGLCEYRFTKLGDASYNHDHRKFSPLIVQQQVQPRPSASFTDAGRTYKYCKEEGDDEVVPISLIGPPPFHLELEFKPQASSKFEPIIVPQVPTNSYNFRIPRRLLTLGTHSLTIRKVQDSRGCQRTIDYDAPHVKVSVADIPSISPLEDETDFCVGDRISFTLSGAPPFNVFYNFQGVERKATVQNTEFKRLAEKPGEFVITAISDQRSADACKAGTQITKVIHEMPSVRVSKGRTAIVDIHEGGEAEILFEFGGTPPFHFTYSRSTTPSRSKKVEVLETKSEVSYEYSKTIRASDEGLYEVVSIRDRYCAFSTQKATGKESQKLLTN